MLCSMSKSLPENPMSTRLAPTPQWPWVWPWLRRALTAWRSRLAASRVAPDTPDPDFSSLAELSDRTLRDIGAPDSMIGRERGIQVWQFERSRW